MLDYVIITAARNEYVHIQETIRSVICQTVLPRRWIVVSDGSTDGTDAVVKSYASVYPWIHLHRRPPRCGRSFAAKSQCLAAGYRIVANTSFDAIAILDADVTLQPDHFAFLLEKFAEMPTLGVAGTPYTEPGYESHAHRGANLLDVPGQCQLFRRACYEAVGGCPPIREGGEDTVAVTMARMLGWQTRTFVGRSFRHHRPMGTASRHLLTASLVAGYRDGLFGNHPLWEVCRAFRQATRRPYVLRGLLLIPGYVWGFTMGTNSLVPRRIRQFRRQEQLQRLQEVFRQMVGGRLFRRTGRSTDDALSPRQEAAPNPPGCASPEMGPPDACRLLPTTTESCQ